MLAAQTYIKAENFDKILKIKEQGHTSLSSVCMFKRYNKAKGCAVKLTNMDMYMNMCDSFTCCFTDPALEPGP